MKFSKFFLPILLLPLAACGTVNIDSLPNISQSAKDKLSEAMPRSVYKSDRPAETIRSVPANTQTPIPPAQIDKAGIVNGVQGNMNCRRSPGGEIMGSYVNGSTINIDDQITDQYGTWYHDARYNCFIHENGVRIQ